MQGLSKQEVLKKQKEHGLNIIEKEKSKTKLEVMIEILKDPIIIIMLAALALTIVTHLKDGHFGEAYVIAGLIILNIVISFVQELKTIAKLESLNKLNEDHALVIRDGERQEVSAIDLVVDDLVVLKLGTIARADLEVIEATEMEVDESFLTGESEFISKNPGDMIYSNSPIQNGSAIAKVVAIGMNTEIGKIVHEVSKVESTKSQLEIKILEITKILMKLAFFMAAVIFVLTLLNGESISTAMSFLISILIATVPEGLATVLTIVLTFMATKMATNNALVKKVSLLETLGEVSYVCSDKTGTITENKMSVSKHIYYADEDLVNGLVKVIIDEESPTTKAISNYVGTKKTLAQDSEFKIVEHLPFNSTNKCSVFILENNANKYLVTIGAPDVLVDTTKLEPEFSSYANDALRTIVVAFYQLENQIDIKDYQQFDYTPLVLFGIQDPPKQSAIDTIMEFEHAGISPVMITGDSKPTATSIAKQTGIIQSENDLVLSHEELNELSDEEFKSIVLDVKVYARAKPEDKVRIVRALQENKQIVAMMGDGTNDSIALRQANVGIAMGINGTDISKDAADLILLDDNYGTIDVAIHGGRLIFVNLRKFVRQMLTSNTAHSSTILFALIIGLFTSKELLLPMTPILILWINIVSDAIPCLALGLDDEENDLMATPPIDPEEPILTKGLIFEILLRGLSIGLLVVIAFNFIINSGGSEIMARSIGFVVLSFGQLIHIFDARSNNTIYRRNPLSNKWVIYAVILSGLLNLALLYTPLSVIFGLTAIKLNVLLVAILYSSIPTFVYSFVKLLLIKKK